jgi:hypothetical protein
MIEPGSGVFTERQNSDTAEPPQVFVRVFQAPAGLPWEQARAAQLEARHGSPLPIADVLHQVKRLGAWSLGEPGRYAAFYVRRAEFSGPFETTVQVEGAPIRVAFGTGATQAARLRQAAALGGLVGATLVIAGVGLTLALGVRSETTAQLDLAQQTLAAKSRALRSAVRQAEQTEALADVAQGGQPVATVHTDLAWVGAAKTPDARIVAVHWDRGLLGVEVRGEAAPFGNGERQVERSDRPIRAGVWLWGVHPDPGLEPAP